MRLVVGVTAWPLPYFDEFAEFIGLPETEPEHMVEWTSKGALAYGERPVAVLVPAFPPKMLAKAAIERVVMTQGHRLFFTFESLVGDDALVQRGTAWFAARCRGVICDEGGVFGVPGRWWLPEQLEGAVARGALHRRRRRQESDERSDLVLMLPRRPLENVVWEAFYRCLPPGATVQAAQPHMDPAPAATLDSVVMVKAPDDGVLLVDARGGRVEVMADHPDAGPYLRRARAACGAGTPVVTLYAVEAEDRLLALQVMAAWLELTDGVADVRSAPGLGFDAPFVESQACRARLSAVDPERTQDVVDWDGERARWIAWAGIDFNDADAEPLREFWPADQPVNAWRPDHYVRIVPRAKEEKALARVAALVPGIDIQPIDPDQTLPPGGFQVEITRGEAKVVVVRYRESHALEQLDYVDLKAADRMSAETALAERPTDLRALVLCAWQPGAAALAREVAVAIASACEGLIAADHVALLPVPGRAYHPAEVQQLHQAAVED